MPFSLPGAKVPGNESSTYGTFAPGNESSTYPPETSLVLSRVLRTDSQIRVVYSMTTLKQASHNKRLTQINNRPFVCPTGGHHCRSRSLLYL